MNKTQCLERLRHLHRRREHLETEIDGLVALLRSPGTDGMCEATWAEIGEALGLTKQGAQMAYRGLSWHVPAE